MTDEREAFVHEAELHLAAGTDPAALGGTVTTELCGHWEHEGPCHWPHNNDVEISDAGATFRTLFIAPRADEEEIRRRIDQALGASEDWTVLETHARPVSAEEQPLAARLAAGPRP